MATEGNGRPSKYQRIADALREAIRSGQYGPGDRLPGENDLMTEYGVARMTARHALAVLQNEGIAESRKGAGSFVRSFRPLRRRSIQRLSHSQWGEGRSIWQADAEGRDVTVDQVTVNEAEVPDYVAPVLGLEAEETACVRSRRYVLDGKPVMLATSYLPMALVAGSAITREDTGPGGIYARLDELGHKPVHYREEVRVRMPSQEEAGRLGLSTGSPVILVCRTAFADNGKPVEVNEMTMDAAAYILEYDFDA
jgi:GntR family transcriptional regulator